MSSGLPLLVAMGVAGLLLWRRVSPGLVPLRPADTSLFAGWAAVLAYVVSFGTGLVLFSLVPGRALLDLLAVQVGASAAGAAVLLAVMARQPDGLGALGLRRHRGAPAPLVALAAWLAFFPAFAGVAWLNTRLLEALGRGAELQAPLRMFLDDPAARRSPLAWLAMVLLLPAFEELVFRGGLQGALRRTLRPAAAVLCSAAMFGVVHEPAAALPAAALGAVLGVLYERTGSLAAPLAFHALHNGLTLLLATLAPEIVT
jgi:uncharacterized protein